MSGPKSIPLVALVGRPNVGKSTLFNRLVGKRVALVDDQPGVTRDRLFGDVRHYGRLLRVIDTGGIELHTGDTLLNLMRAQTQLAIEQADCVVLVLDSSEGLTPGDRDVASILRRSGRPLVVVANKVDEPRHEDRLGELYGLGFDAVLPLSAEHGRGTDELLDLLTEMLDPPLAEAIEQEHGPIPVAALEDASDGNGAGAAEASRVEWPGGAIHVAVIGRPNAGKSSLINRLLGEERLLASDIPGTTRDAVDTELVHEGQRYVLIDTAGMRRQRSVAEKLEKYAVMVAQRSIERADVAVLLLDAGVPVAEQDAKIAAMAHDMGKGLVIVSNKWDLMKPGEEAKEHRESVFHTIRFASYATHLKLSAKTGAGVQRLLPEILNIQRERHRRVTTGELNRFFEYICEFHPPPVRGGKRPKLLFASQPLVRPPTFVFTARRSKDIHFSYQRYLSNALRERYGFGGTPIWLKFREGR